MSEISVESIRKKWLGRESQDADEVRFLLAELEKKSSRIPPKEMAALCRLAVEKFAEETDSDEDQEEAVFGVLAYVFAVDREKVEAYFRGVRHLAGCRKNVAVSQRACGTLGEQLDAAVTRGRA